MAFSMLMGTFIYGQDIHFTQFNFAPLTVNPAMTGAFNGTVRIGGILRDQWSSTYTTPAFYVDSPILKGFRKQDWIGAGLSFVQDQANASYLPFSGGDPIDGSIKVSGALGSAAYHLALDKKRKTVLAIGIQGGTLSRSVDGRFKFEDEILNGGASMDMLPETDKGKSLLDISGGLTLTGSTKDKSAYRIGISAMHINQPRNSVLQSGGRSELPMRLVGYATYHMDLNEKFLIIPSLLYQSISSASELSLQGMAGYKMPEQDLVVKGGLGYRLGDAVEVLVGVDYKDLRVGASYDITTSDLVSPNGGFEIAVSYIAKIYKRPKIDPVIFCPRF